MTDVLLFGALPYVAIVLLVVVSVWRYRSGPYTISSLSSQFLESDRLFWGSVPLHVGILTLFFGHLVGFLFPREVLAWNGAPVRLVVLELTALVAGLLFLTGLSLLIIRRVRTDRLRRVTTWLDLVVYALLLYMACTGLYVALYLRWGSSWYTQIAVPYLRSIFLLQPNVALVAQLPLAVRLHIIGAFALFSVFSFTRLIHILVAPLPYLWRPVQLVLWNRERRTLRRPGAAP